jgi:predicted CoA-binding protein
MRISDSGELKELISRTKFVHVLGAGVSSEKPANRAISDLSERGWNPIPVHPRDAGASIVGYPIRPSIEDGVRPDVVVLFLAPERARKAVKRLLVTNYDSPAIVWFQPGSEDTTAEDWLREIGWNYVKNDCIVRFVQRHDLKVESEEIPWFKQVQRDDGSGCSVWSVHEFREDAEKSQTELEWIGDLRDLEHSKSSIPNYIRSLRNDGESLEECARRLAN